MAKEEIISGLQNAVTRGESLEKAMQSMINAGYNAREVQEAVHQIKAGGSMGLTGQMHPAQQAGQAPGQAQQPGQPPEQAQIQQTRTIPEPNTPIAEMGAGPKKKFPWKIIIPGIVLVLLLIGLGIMLFGDKILEMIG